MAVAVVCALHDFLSVRGSCGNTLEHLSCDILDGIGTEPPSFYRMVAQLEQILMVVAVLMWIWRLLRFKTTHAYVHT